MSTHQIIAILALVLAVISILPTLVLLIGILLAALALPVRL
jgi:hypothetical protein